MRHTSTAPLPNFNDAATLRRAGGQQVGADGQRAHADHRYAASETGALRLVENPPWQGIARQAPGSSVPDVAGRPHDGRASARHKKIHEIQGEQASGRATHRPRERYLYDALLMAPRQARLLPDSSSHNTFGAMIHRVKDALASPTPKFVGSAAVTSEPLTQNSTDKMVRKRLRAAGRQDDEQAFDSLWQGHGRGLMDAQSRIKLAALYASTMQARCVAADREGAFNICVDIGFRALELDEGCMAATERLALAYSIVQAPLVQAEQLCDQVVDAHNLSELRGPGAAIHSNAPRCHHVSSDFYYAYWRTFRGNEQRTQQVACALRSYYEAPPSERHFDEHIRSFQMFAAMMA